MAYRENDTPDSAAVDLPVLAYRHYTAEDAATGEVFPLITNDENACGSRCPPVTAGPFRSATSRRCCGGWPKALRC